MSVVGLWVVTLYYVFVPIAAHFHPEDGGDKFRRNVDNHLQGYTGSQSRRPFSAKKAFVFSFLQFLFQDKLTQLIQI
jgi:hypothetical protein